MEFGGFGRASVTGAYASVTETRLRRFKFSGLSAISGTLVLAPLPRSFRDPAVGWPAIMRAVRPPILDATARSTAPAARPFVYATLGTVFNLESGDLLHRLVRALQRAPVDALVTVGPHIEPAEFGAAADHVRIEPFVPQEEVLGRCAAVVSHGGSGTLVASLSLGVPVVVLPMGADQPDNADRCEELGVGLVLDALQVDASMIAAAVERVTSDDRFAAAAAVLAAEAAQQPPLREVEDLVALLG